MEAKLNHSDLSQLLSKEADITLVKAEVLTKAFFDLIIEGLEEDGVVKINGLGTFKITEVADRSSVNVNTGEKFEIKGHNKLTFIPADSLKDNVNQPFAMFEPVEVNADLCDEEQLEEENEMVDNVEETIVEEAAAEAVIVEKAAKTVVEEAVAEPVEEVAEEAAVEEVAEEAVIVEEAAEAVVEEKVATAPVQRPEPVLVRVPKKDKGMKKDAPKKEKRNFIPYYIILLVAIIVAAVYLFYNADVNIFKNVEKTTASQEKNVPGVVEKTAIKQNSLVVVADTIKSITPTEENDDAYAFVMLEELEARDLAKITVADVDLYTITGELCRHNVKNNETLTRIALKYYGSKKLWPYLVKHNKLAKPDDLCKGMEISIPMLKPAK